MWSIEGTILSWVAATTIRTEWFTLSSIIYNHSAVVGFEDIFRGGDLDYDDAVVKVWGDIGVAHIPEPSTMLILGSGFLCLAYVLRFN
jgi:hypothetical protein